MQETLDLALELNCEFANFYCAMAYPGSQLYERALGRGLAAARDVERLLAAQRRHAAAPHAPSRRGEVLRFRDDAFQTYFRDPALPGAGGARLRRRRCVREISEMTAHRLDRRFAA